MTGRTHDLAAFTALTVTLATQPLHHMTLATAIVAFTANMIGGLAPDIDQPTADLYHRIRGGSFVSHLIAPMLGGHRFLSHSLLGLFLFGWLTRTILGWMSAVLIVDMNIVWWSFMIGFGSHLIMDTVTREGVPWLFPLPVHLGVPPFKALRMKTGGFLEKFIVFPALVSVNIYIYYLYHARVLDFLRHYIK